MSKPVVTEEDFLGWLQHPVTQAVRQVLAAKRADLRNEWEMSEPLSFHKDELILANVANIGWCRGLAFAETIDYETYVSEIDNGEPERSRAAGSSGTDQDV